MNFTTSYSFSCTFGNDKSTWQLVVLGDNNGKINFQLYDQQGQHWQVKAFNLDLMPLPDRSFIGFEISQDNKVIAALSMRNPGKAWVDNTLELEQQQLLLNALTNLWLHKYALEYTSA